DRTSWSVVRVPLIPIPKEGDDVDHVADSFTEFVRESLAKPQIHRLDPGAVGKEIHMKKPLCLGGDWNDKTNLVAVTPVQHAELARYWNKLYRDLLIRQRNGG